jgi:hypothetical protein
MQVRLVEAAGECEGYEGEGDEGEGATGDDRFALTTVGVVILFVVFFFFFFFFLVDEVDPLLWLSFQCGSPKGDCGGCSRSKFSTPTDTVCE